MKVLMSALSRCVGDLTQKLHHSSITFQVAALWLQCLSEHDLLLVMFPLKHRMVGGNNKINLRAQGDE